MKKEISIIERPETFNGYPTEPYLEASGNLSWYDFVTAMPSLVFIVTGWKSNGNEFKTDYAPTINAGVEYMSGKSELQKVSEETMRFMKCAIEKGLDSCCNCKKFNKSCNPQAGYVRGIEARSMLADDVIWAILPYVSEQYGN